ncbi:molybdopterin molybdotransferase MoeA [soil metagenome]
MEKDAPLPAATSPAGFDSPAAALAALLERIRPLALGGQSAAGNTEVRRLRSVTGRILAEPVRAERPSPAVDVSAMDGFAVRCADLRDGVRLRIAGEVRIGVPPPPCPPGACLRIVTGGGLPQGADAIIKVEDARENDAAITVDAALRGATTPGRFIRRAGENCAEGAIVAAAGTLITPAVAAALALAGAAAPKVVRPLHVGIISTGDELANVDADVSTLQPHQVRDANGESLRAFLSQHRWIGALTALRVGDDPAPLRAALQGDAGLLTRCDAILITGGVSMGPRDAVPAVLEALGVTAVFKGVPQRPGKPILAGVSADGSPVLGLPGNPLSVLVTARRFALAALARRAGLSTAGNPIFTPAAVTLVKSDDAALPLWWHRPARLVSPGVAEVIDVRSSGDAIGAALSDGFVEVPPGAVGTGPWPWWGWM